MAKFETKLKKNGNQLFPQAMLNGIDVGNVLGSGISSYIATEDCIAICYGASGSLEGVPRVLIDNTDVATPSTGGVVYGRTPIFIKKGQTLSMSGGIGSKIEKVFGIKR